MHKLWQIPKSVQISSIFWFEMDENYRLPAKMWFTPVRMLSGAQSEYGHEMP